MNHWKRLYLSAILATDRQDPLIDAAVNAIDGRLDELNEMEGYAEERKEIAEATTALLALKTQRKSWGVGPVS